MLETTSFDPTSLGAGGSTRAKLPEITCWSKVHETSRVLASLMCHPNAGGVLLLGLGREDNQVESQLETATDVDRLRFRYFNSQDVEDGSHALITATSDPDFRGRTDHR